MAAGISAAVMATASAAATSISSVAIVTMFDKLPFLLSYQDKVTRIPAHIFGTIAVKTAFRSFDVAATKP